MKRIITHALTVAAITVAIGSTQVHAAGIDTTPSLKRLTWTWDGLFGRYDQKQLQRGWTVYSEVCAACHAVKYLRYRDLEGIGLTKAQTEELAAAAEEIQDGFDDAGEPFFRTRIPSDPIQQPYANEEQAKAANGGVAPPDLSMITKARKRGPDYVFGIQTGYPSDFQGEPPEWWIKQFADPKTGEYDFPADKYFNNFFAGHAISMPPQYVDGVVYEDGSSPTQEQGLIDVITFLNWASDPNLEARKTMGLWVLVYLGVLAGFLYALKTYIWRDVEH
ncbi:cytochrome c1 [Phaeovibrio sulfidiphilus]|uniref:Cytochrome c1 n=1 Tax=Phaeovibrio sulfidiphilus TaxID=1220600 RepID=A0A8J7CC78_9PROT|nr:cytochrome c1 [Phaeovibrio sulfidiphilus]MBE1236978.1 cytochrome c1 [Phaeovibrio sulfidiphilus]